MILQRVSSASAIKLEASQMKSILLFISLMASSAFAIENTPDCSGTQQWATSMAFVHLKNSGITNNEKLDFSKTLTKRIASEKIGKDLYRQVHHITFTEKSSNVIQVITVSDASNDECSMSGVDVYIVSKKLGDLR